IGQVGRTGRASSPHLHLEIRKNNPAGEDERNEDELAIEPTVQDRTFAFPAGDWTSTVSSLVSAGVLDEDGSQGQKQSDKLTQEDALEMVLRCLERHRARAHNLASLDPMQVGLDFNRRFAGETEAEVAARKAKLVAMKAAEAKKKAEADRVASARKAAKAAGKKSRVKARPVKPVEPEPILDPGFEALAQSKKTLTRAEGCLLLATTLRAGTERMSALQRAAVRVAQSE